jgi:hypothetical protein
MIEAVTSGPDRDLSDAIQIERIDRQQFLGSYCEGLRSNCWSSSRATPDSQRWRGRSVNTFAEAEGPV